EPEVAAEEDLQPGQEQQQAAPERAPPPPTTEVPPAPGHAAGARLRNGCGCHVPLLRSDVRRTAQGPRGSTAAGLVRVRQGKHSSLVMLTCRSRPFRVNVPALVDQAIWCRLLMMTLSACWPKPPARPCAFGPAASNGDAS